jgi:hypothetical protein
MRGEIFLTSVIKIGEVLEHWQSIGCVSRYYRVLTMVYNTQRYWVFGLCASSGFFLNKNEKHNVSETGSVSVVRWGKTPTLLGPLERAHLTWGRKQIQFPKRCVFHCYLGKIRTMDKVRKPSISMRCVLRLRIPSQLLVLNRDLR